MRKPNVLRSLICGLAALQLCTSPATTHAGLSLLTSEAGAYAYDSVTGVGIDDRDPWTAQAASGGTRSSFDLVTGIGRSYTTTAAPAVKLGGALSSLGFAFTLYNDGLLPVLFEAGDVAVEVDAAVATDSATGSSGVFALLGGFFRMATIGQGRGGQGLFSYILNDSPLVPGVELLFTDTSLTGIAAVDVRQADATGVDLLFSFGQFTIAPKKSATFEFEFSADVNADTGGFALVDALNTARLTMQLPEGTDLQSPQRLGWVTSAPNAIPEPATATLFTLGFVALGIAARKRRATPAGPSRVPHPGRPR